MDQLGSIAFRIVCLLIFRQFFLNSPLIRAADVLSFSTIRTRLKLAFERTRKLYEKMKRPKEDREEVASDHQQEYLEGAEPAHLSETNAPSSFEEAIRIGELENLLKLVEGQSTQLSAATAIRWIMAALRLGSVSALEMLEDRGMRWPRRPNIIGPVIQLHLREDNEQFAVYLFKGVVAEYKVIGKLDTIGVWVFEQLIEFSSASDGFKMMVELGIVDSDKELLKKFLYVRNSELDDHTLEKIIELQPELVNLRLFNQNSLVAQAFVDKRFSRVQLLVELGANLNAIIEETEVSGSRTCDGGDLFVGTHLTPWLKPKAKGKTVAAAIQKYGSKALKSLVARYSFVKAGVDV